jgi:hypothetical protein
MHAHTGTRQSREDEDEVCNKVVMMPLESDVWTASRETVMCSSIPRKGGMPRTGSYDNLTYGFRQLDLKSCALLGDEVGGDDGECLSLDSLSRSSTVHRIISAVESHASDVLLEASSHGMQEACMSGTGSLSNLLERRSYNCHDLGVSTPEQNVRNTWSTEKPFKTDLGNNSTVALKHKRMQTIAEGAHETCAMDQYADSRANEPENPLPSFVAVVEPIFFNKVFWWTLGEVRWVRMLKVTCKAFSLCNESSIFKSSSLSSIDSWQDFALANLVDIDSHLAYMRSQWALILNGSDVASSSSFALMTSSTEPCKGHSEFHKKSIPENSPQMNDRRSTLEPEDGPSKALWNSMQAGKDSISEAQKIPREPNHAITQVNLRTTYGWSLAAVGQLHKSPKSFLDMMAVLSCGRTESL